LKKKFSFNQYIRFQLLNVREKINLSVSYVILLSGDQEIKKSFF